MKHFILTSTLFLSIIIYSFGQINPATNKLSMDISTSAQNSSVFNYDSCFKVGKTLGISSVGMFQTWKAVETSPLNYNMSLFDIANLYYPANNMAIDLTLTPINTNVLEVPTDLTVTAMSSTVMIARFNRLLDSIKVHIPNVTLSSLVIGSEHDVYFGSNATKWAEYGVFYNAVITHAKTLWPGIKVATELTFNGITTYSSLAQALNSNSDYIGVSYYPLNTNFTVKPVSTIPIDFATLVNIFPSKPICFYQYGYPSSSTCNSSDVLQSQFITQTFQTWDLYHNNIRMIDFTWIHDLDPAYVTTLGTYYNLNDPIFLEYLRTLGLRTWTGNGTDKPALHELRCQAKARGYNNLNLSCSFTNINNQISETVLMSVFPNPANESITLKGFNTKEAIQIINSLGETVKTITLENHSEKINISDLPNGFYIIKSKSLGSLKFLKD